jgi:SAM-dependent methyltransferase
MLPQQHIQKLIDAGRRRGFWRHGFDLQRHSKQIFGGVSLQGKRMLELGSGRGVFSMWAAIHGATRVVGLEPMADGFYDAKNFMDNFQSMVREVGVNTVEVDPTLVQNYRAPDGSFDVVLSVHSLNHLDEDACIRLRQDAAARQTYVDIFRNVRRMLVPGGKLVIIDCSSRSLWSDLGLKNPFNPDIEWHKHQPAEMWAEVLALAGFGKTLIQHPGMSLFRYLRIPYIPAFLAYCMDGMFRIEMTAL